MRPGFVPRVAALYAAVFLYNGIQLPFLPVWFAAKQVDPALIGLMVAVPMLARILSVAKDRGRIVVNPCERGGRLYNATRVDSIWSIDDEAAFLQHAPAHLHLALLLALWTGQRQGDLLRLTWSAYDGKHIRLRQSKSMRRTLTHGPSESIVQVAR